MATRRNPYADPALTQAFNNIASMFAPPGGADMAGYATAAAKRAEADRLSWLFNNSADPTASARSALTGVQGYGQTPAGFGMTDMTNRRGQDIDAGTKLRQTEMQQAGELARLYATPRVVGQNDTLIVPNQTQAATGFAPTMTGIVEAKPGDRKFLADGRMIEGAPKQLSSDELKAKIMQDEMAAGRLPAEAAIGSALGTPQTIQTPQGPRITTPGQAMLSGATPYTAPSNSARKDGMALLPGGQRVPVTRAPDALQWQMQDGTPVPPEAQVFDLAKPQGTNEQLGITSSNVTEANRIKSSLDAAEFTVRQMREILQKNPNVAGVPGRVKGVLQSLGSSAAQVAKAYAAEAPSASMSLEEAKAQLERVAGGYDPDIVRLQSGIMDLAYARAQIGNPSGEVSRQAFERALESFGQSYLSSQQDLETGLAAFERDTLAAGRVKVNSLRGGQSPVAAPAGATTPQQSGPAERFVRDPTTGKITRVQ
jgi:hypothetical protein